MPGGGPGPAPHLPTFKKPESLREFMYNLNENYKNMMGVSVGTLGMVLDSIERYIEANSETDMSTAGLCVYVGPHVAYCDICKKPDMVHTHT